MTTLSRNKLAAKHHITPKLLRDWIKNEDDIKISFATLKRSRLRKKGGGRKLKFRNVDEASLQFFKDCRKNKLRVTQKRLRMFAEKEWRKLQNEGKVDSNLQFRASRGWMEKFMKRHALSFRRKTTVSQRIPEECIQKAIRFIRSMVNTRREQELENNQIIGCDETSIWLDAVGNSTLAEKGSKDVPLKSTGHEKARLTIMLTARADGRKLPVFILIPRKRPIKKLVDKYRGKAVIKFEGTSWMNEELTRTYLNEVIKRNIFGTKRLLIWDDYKPHHTDATKQCASRLNVVMRLIPPGMTSLLQPADVCWNKPVKQRIKEMYDEWWLSEEQTYTAQGNVRAPDFVTVVGWILDAWEEITSEMIRHSFKACGITTEPDGSDMDDIMCFQPRRPCEEGKNDLKQLFDDLVNGIDVLEEDDPFAECSGESDYESDEDHMEIHEPYEEEDAIVEDDVLISDIVNDSDFRRNDYDANDDCNSDLRSSDSHGDNDSNDSVGDVEPDDDVLISDIVKDSNFRRNDSDANDSNSNLSTSDSDSDNESDDSVGDVEPDEFKRFLYENTNQIIEFMAKTRMPRCQNPYVSFENSGDLCKFLKMEKALLTFRIFLENNHQIQNLQSGCSLILQNTRFEKAYVHFMEKYFTRGKLIVTTIETISNYD